MRRWRWLSQRDRLRAVFGQMLLSVKHAPCSASSASWWALPNSATQRSATASSGSSAGPLLAHFSLSVVPATRSSSQFIAYHDPNGDSQCEPHRQPFKSERHGFALDEGRHLHHRGHAQGACLLQVVRRYDRGWPTARGRCLPTPQWLRVH